MQKYLLDTNIIIHYLRKNKKSLKFLNTQLENIVSVVTVGEVYQGVKNKKELADAKQLVVTLKVLPVDSEISAVCIELLEKYRLSSGLFILDSFIAATAIKHNLTLLTENVKDFKMIKGLKVKKW